MDDIEWFREEDEIPDEFRRCPICGKWEEDPHPHDGRNNG